MKTKRKPKLKQKPKPGPGMLRRGLAARRLGVGLRQLAEMRHNGSGPPCFKIGNRYKYDAELLEKWIEERRVNPQVAR